MYKERIIELPQITDHRGTLSFAEIEQHIPFGISQIRWGDIPDNHVEEQKDEIIIVLAGSVEIVVDDERKYILDQPQKALLIPHNNRRTVGNKTTNALCLVISSDSNGGGERRRTLLNKYSVEDCSIIKLSEIADNVISTNVDIPFDIKRIFYISDIPEGEERGMHVHKLCHEILIAVNGSFDVELDDGISKKTVTLNDSASGLHIPPGIWAVEKGYSQSVICLVLASDKYDAGNYINKYSDFIKYRQNGN